MSTDTIVAMIDAADVTAPAAVRLDGIRRLLDDACARPIPAPRWAVLKARITAELARRAEIEERPAQTVLETEIEAAIALAAPLAQARAVVAFAKTFQVELRREVSDLICDAILGDWRHLTAGMEVLDTMEAPGADPAAAVHAARLLERVTVLADLTAGEERALCSEISGGSGEQRMALSRARAKARSAVSPDDR